MVDPEPPHRPAVGVGVAAQELGGRLTAERVAGQLPRLVGADPPTGDPIDNDGIGAARGCGRRRLGR